MNIPSLTPNADAVEQAIKQLYLQLAPEMAKAGNIAAITRITFALSTTACLALAKEGDLRTSRSVMVDGIINAVCNVIVQSCQTLFDSDEAAIHLADTVRRTVAERAGVTDIPGVRVAVPVQQMGEA